MITLQPGDIAPLFTLLNQNGEPVSLEQYRGSRVLLYFYPKDDTVTCTSQACNLRDNHELLHLKGLTVLGISPDDVNSHKKFEQKYNLPFHILADSNHEAIDKYGVWGEKSLYGHKYMGVIRTTFLIDAEGKIEHIITTIKSKEHTKQVLKEWGLNKKDKAE